MVALGYTGECVRSVSVETLLIKELWGAILGITRRDARSTIAESVYRNSHSPLAPLQEATSRGEGGVCGVRALTCFQAMNGCAHDGVRACACTGAHSCQYDDIRMFRAMVRDKRMSGRCVCAREHAVGRARRDVSTDVCVQL